MDFNTFMSLSGLLPFPNPYGSENSALESAPTLDKVRKTHSPLSAFADYPPVMQVYINHWQSVNAALAESSSTPILLQGGYAVENLIADRAAILDTINEQPGLDNERSIAAAARDQAKEALLARFYQLRAAMIAALYGSPELEMIPRKPISNSIRSRFLQPFYEMKNLWTAINALAPSPDFTPPLTLGTYAIEGFAAEITALEGIYAQLNSAEGAARHNRRMRDSLLPPAKARLVQYQNAVIGRLGRNHPMTASIPLLSRSGGSTPKAVTLTGAWDAAEAKARLTWTMSSNKRLDHYEVRSAPGPKYDTKEERVVARVAKTETEFLTDSGLTVPGASALFRVYVALTTGNAKGSETVRVERVAEQEEEL